MTKKDYILIAKSLSASLPTEYQHEHTTATEAWYQTVIRLANTLEKENPLFDRKKFLIACGL